MSKSRKILFKFRSDDSCADGLDPWELNEKCLKGQTQGLVSKSVTDHNDGESVFIELEFETRLHMKNWVEGQVDPSYYPIATQL